MLKPNESNTFALDIVIIPLDIVSYAWIIDLTLITNPQDYS